MSADQDIEVELKLALPQDQLEKVFDIFKAKDNASKVKDKFRPRDYYDTEDLIVSKRSAALRVQLKEGKGFEQTIKAEIEGQEAATDTGVMARMEWKDYVQKNKPDVKSIANDQARGVLKGIENKDLSHIFTAEVKRRFFDLEVVMPDGSNAVVELAFDVGRVYLPKPHTGSAEVCEIEIEQKSGSPEAIDLVRDEIIKIAPDAQVSTISKAALGYGLHREATSKRHKKSKSNKSAPKP